MYELTQIILSDARQTNGGPEVEQAAGQQGGARHIAGRGDQGAALWGDQLESVRRIPQRVCHPPEDLGHLQGAPAAGLGNSTLAAQASIVT